MREIKFRGIAHTAKCFVYGNLLIGKFRDTPLVQIEHTDSEEFRQWSVEPETVGQYTGLKDKNGVEIYEGDILEMQWNWREYESGSLLWKPIQVTIGFSNGAFWFQGDGHTDCNWHFYNANERKVVGNIHENPELLSKSATRVPKADSRSSTNP